MTGVQHSRANAVVFFERYVEEHAASLAGKHIYDLSAGSGYIAALFEKAGAVVHAYDLFPGQNRYVQSGVKFIDLQQPFPINAGAADLVLCAETIEHLPNQFFFFKEVARILAPTGVFMLTTPNPSSLRSRFSQLLMESEHYSHPAPNETDAFTRWEGSHDGYFSKLFISGMLRLRTLAALQGLRIKKHHPSARSSTSYLLLLFYPVIFYFSRKHLRKQLRHDVEHAAIYREIFKLNTSWDVLLGKHLILEICKERVD